MANHNSFIATITATQFLPIVKTFDATEFFTLNSTFKYSIFKTVHAAYNYPLMPTLNFTNLAAIFTAVQYTHITTKQISDFIAFNAAVIATLSTTFIPAFNAADWQANTRLECPTN